LCRRTDITEKDVQRHIDRIVEVRGTDPAKLEGYKSGMLGDVVNGPRHAWVKEWTARQVYIAFGNFMTAAAALGVDTCPMEGLDPAKYDVVLKLQGTGYETVAACPAGYRSSEDPMQKNKKVRFEDSQVVQYI
jgi:nitroreductase